MPVGPTNTKAQKQKVVKTEMHKFGQGKLHSGSKKGPVVTNPKQAIAISLSESGQSKPKNDMPPAKGRAPKAGEGESKKSYDRSSHFKGNPGFPESKHEPNQTYAQEQHEHWGSKAEGTTMGPHGTPANVGGEKRGSKLTDQTNGPENASQPKGNGIGIKTNDQGTEKHFALGPAHCFPCATNSHGFGHGVHVRSGALRNSGHPGAHRLGKR